MTASLRPFVAGLIGFSPCGLLLAAFGSVHAADPPPAVIDLVELAVTLPDIVSRTEFLEVELKRMEGLVDRGTASSLELRRLRSERDAANKKLELLRTIIQYEHAVCESRLKVANSQRDIRGTEAELEIEAMQLRCELLKRMGRLAGKQGPGSEEEATSQIDIRTTDGDAASETAENRNSC